MAVTFNRNSAILPSPVTATTFFVRLRTPAEDRVGRDKRQPEMTNGSRASSSGSHHTCQAAQAPSRPVRQAQQGG